MRSNYVYAKRLDIERSSAAYDPEVATSASSRRLNRRVLKELDGHMMGLIQVARLLESTTRYVTTFLVYPISKQRD